MTKKAAKDEGAELPMSNEESNRTFVSLCCPPQLVNEQCLHCVFVC